MHISTEVYARDNFGRFIADIEESATEAVTQGLKVGESVAQSVAPVRTGRLRGSFLSLILSRTSGVLGNTAPYARFQDEGAGPHAISAYVSFFWEREGRMWLSPPAYLARYGHPGADPINHPGNPATHFMDAGYDAIKRAMPGIIQAVYPG